MAWRGSMGTPGVLLSDARLNLTLMGEIYKPHNSPQALESHRRFLRYNLRP